ncbi:MBL fold metallo-hydrolase [Ampullimonas aquatilis]|uniref:MBL fold metallo-hydrolase n=1 Tax=Ampullimonas aquatilis TaxID=1341549 RepID=UPI003C748F48
MKFNLCRYLVLLLALGMMHRVWAGQLHVFTSDVAGFNTHSFWYDDGQEVTVVDAQFTTAQAEALLNDIRSHTRSRIKRIIVTHPNPDKFNGLSVFHRAGIQSMAAANTAAAMPDVDAYKRHFWVQIAKAFTDATYPQFEPVETTFKGKQQIRLASGETISLIELPKAGISSHQTVVRIDASGDLIVGDLVHTRTHAWLEGGIVNGKPVPNLPGWKTDLLALNQLGRGKVYGGRGEFVPVKQAVAEQMAYLDQADQIVSAYIKDLGERVSELSDPARQGQHYAAIQARLVAAYPDYAMPDLVGYSVYGLVAQKLGH